MTGLLTSSFILYYGISNLSSDNEEELTINDINGTLGTVSVKDPIHTLQVRQLADYSTFIYIYTHTHTHTQVYGSCI